ncbi:hypothetical protein [Undibacterium sp. Ren11W]|uniref:hypothetical protein n=1 Tax=Undibacterium sp. Ren11W TaxID=3413045 RepID=UPI003BF06733
MITITFDQLRLLDSDIRHKFAVKLSTQLRADYTDLFAPLPPALTQRMVARKIDYAEERYEIHFQSALTTYLHYCCAIGPAFDTQSEIQSVLDDLSLYPDDIPDLLPDRVSDQGWEEADQQARKNGKSAWFDATPKGLSDEVAARFCWAKHASNLETLHQESPTNETADADLTAYITKAMQAARTHQINDATGMAAFAFCMDVLGADFIRLHGKAWVPAVFHDTAILPVLRSATLVGCTELEWRIAL